MICYHLKTIVIQPRMQIRKRYHMIIDSAEINNKIDLKIMPNLYQPNKM